ncbi:hypothetical protein HEP87_26840 [Streptomyces sp. S1D4-11]|nr:hypothetical protein [Streptomyces sp. S1D4-11]QIY96957.1 hypothetical protein HEP87_26840 [Streptomyces sp. S1D4-11]
MTTTSAETTDETDLKRIGKKLVRSATSDRGRAAAQALVEEETILQQRGVLAALNLLDPRPVVRWEALSGRVYSLDLDDEQRAFLRLTLSMVGIGQVSLTAVSDLGERRLAVMLRAIARLAGNDTIAVGTRL